MNAMDCFNGYSLTDIHLLKQQLVVYKTTDTFGTDYAIFVLFVLVAYASRAVLMRLLTHVRQPEEERGEATPLGTYNAMTFTDQGPKEMLQKLKENLELIFKGY